MNQTLPSYPVSIGHVSRNAKHHGLFLVTPRSLQSGDTAQHPEAFPDFEALELSSHQARYTGATRFLRRLDRALTALFDTRHRGRPAA